MQGRIVVWKSWSVQQLARRLAILGPWRFTVAGVWWVLAQIGLRILGWWWDNRWGEEKEKARVCGCTVAGGQEKCCVLHSVREVNSERIVCQPRWIGGRRYSGCRRHRRHRGGRWYRGCKTAARAAVDEEPKAGLLQATDQCNVGSATAPRGVNGRRCHGSANAVRTAAGGTDGVCVRRVLSARARSSSARGCLMVFGAGKGGVKVAVWLIMVAVGRRVLVENAGGCDPR